MIPTSNVGGNNQTSPGVSTNTPPPAQPIFQPVTSGTGNPVTNNPFFSGGGSLPGAGTTPGGANFYDPTSSYSSGQSNIDKQLVDIYGKGVGGELDTLLKGMSGTDSTVFQQWYQGMAPVWQQQRAQLGQSEGTAGISANSSVSAIADSSLAAQQSAQASQENAQIIEQNLQDTIGIVQGTQKDATSEVASSGWDVFGQVLEGVGALGGATLGAAGEAGGFSSLFS